MRTETIEIGIYGLGVALLGLLVWQGFETKKEYGEGWKDGPRTSAEFAALKDKLEAAGDAAQPDEIRLSYSQKWVEWWRLIQTSNWTGKLPPPPPVETTQDNAVTEKPVEVLEPIGDLLEITTMKAGTSDDTQLILIRYKRDVTPPATNGVGASATGGGSFDTMGMGGVSSALGQPYHILAPGDPLWKPFETIVFKGCETTADGSQIVAVFTRPKPGGNDGETVDQTLTVAEFALGNTIADSTKDALGATSVINDKSSDGVKERTWKDPGDRTQRVGDVWMISKVDNSAFESDYDRILTQDFVTSDYVSQRKDEKTGERLRGVSFQRVSDSVARFGVKSGDLLVAVNGQEVTSKANALNVGRKQYDRGVRTFELTFLSNGVKVVRTYTAPEK
ncbi:MAG: hypothetical protein H6832_16780 [Planctomycetes bacterium]|nr:hypothetical protein [Planctomycetota bacterium]MCB9890720.1 hypothetical protein [Planctomycetota bacterium]MCB9920057.1 hypothetical protein [Planctomycetota bacterium]